MKLKQGKGYLLSLPDLGTLFLPWQAWITEEELQRNISYSTIPHQEYLDMQTDVVVFFQLDKSTGNEEVGEENERALTQKIRGLRFVRDA